MRPQPSAAELPFVARHLHQLTAAVVRRPRRALFACVMTAIGCLALAWAGLDFKAKRSDLIDADAPFHKRWASYVEDFGDGDEAVVVIEGVGDVDGAVTWVVTQLKSSPDLFEDVQSIAEMRSSALPPLRDLQTARRRVNEYRPVLAGKWDLLRLDSVATRLAWQLESRVQDGAQSSDVEPLLGHVNRLAESLSVYGEPDRAFRSPWPSFLRRQPPARFPVEGRNVRIVRAVPIKEDDQPVAVASIEAMRETLAVAGRQFPGLRFEATGLPLLEYDETIRSRQDMMLASALSLVGVAVILCCGFRGLRYPLIGVGSLAIGLAWALGFATLAIGHLNILSMAFAAILTGLGIDFGVHYLSRYIEWQRTSADEGDGAAVSPAGSAMNASTSVGGGIVIAGATTALGFVCVGLTDFVGIAELGIIAAGGVLLCALSALIVIPSLLVLCDSKRALPIPSSRLCRWWQTTTSQSPRRVAAVSLSLILMSGTFAINWQSDSEFWRVRYDDNLLRLQAEGTPAVDGQKRLIELGGTSLLFAVSVADDPMEARRLKNGFAALPEVARAVDLVDFLPAGTTEQRQTAVALRQTLHDLPRETPRVRRINPADVGKALERLMTGLRATSHPRAQRALVTIDGFLERLDGMTFRDQVALLNQFQRHMTADLIAHLVSLRETVWVPLFVSELPDSLRRRYRGESGRWLIQVFPRKQIWDGAPLRRFVAAIRTVDPDVTGTPVQNFEAGGQVRSSYLNAAWLAVAAIGLVLLTGFQSSGFRGPVLLPPLVVVLMAPFLSDGAPTVTWTILFAVYVGMALTFAAVLDSRSARDVVMAMIPPGLGMVATLGLLAILGIDLNPANLIVLPLVLAIGVDDGVHVVHDFRRQTGPYRISASTVNGILQTSLTSMMGFGSLLLAAHRGLHSLGAVLVIGVGACLFVSLTVLPSVLAIVGGHVVPVRREDVVDADRTHEQRSAA